MTETNFFAESTDQVRQYVNDKILLTKLQLTEKASRVSAALVSGVLMVIFGFFVLMFLGITLGYLFSQWVNNYALGFGLVTLLFIILLVGALMLKKKVIDSFVINKVLHLLLDKKQ